MFIDLSKIDLSEASLKGTLYPGAREPLRSNQVTLTGLSPVVSDLRYYLAVQRLMDGSFEVGIMIESESEERDFCAWFMQLLPLTAIDEDCHIRLQDVLGGPPDQLQTLLAAAFARVIAPSAILEISLNMGKQKGIDMYLAIHQHTPRMFETGDSFTEESLNGLIVDSFKFDEDNQ